MDDVKLKILNSKWKGFKKTSNQLPPLPHEIPPHLRQFFAGKGRQLETVRPNRTSTAWWIAATGFPLLAGTLGPIANLFSVCALVQTWRIDKLTGERISDPRWLLALNCISLTFAVIANVFLLLNFARRVRYFIAQFVTITLWYISSIFLLIPFGILTLRIYDDEQQSHSQSYFYALIAGIIYAIISTFLLINVIGTLDLSLSISKKTEVHVLRRRYNPNFKILSIPQRTIMLQTISFVLYVALMAGVYAVVEDWSFVDSVYWVDYTLLTVGLGSDLTLKTDLGRFLLIPFSLFGFILLGLVVNSVRSLLIERARAKRRARNLVNRRDKWQRKFDENMERMYQQSRRSTGREPPTGKSRSQSEQAEVERLDHELWLKKEFELMRHIENVSEMLEKYSSAGVALFGFLLVWIGGSLVFWSCEKDVQGWTYPNAIYFAYVSITTIGFGDFYPSSTAGKPFFVLWSLIAVPSVTALIGGVGDTIGSWVEDGTTWFWRKTILPEPQGVDARGNELGNDSTDYGPEESSSDSEGDGEDEGSANRKPSFTVQGEGSSRNQRDANRGRHISDRNHLILKLSKEMVKLVSDLTHGEKMDAFEKRYTWDNWERWLILLERLSKREEGVERDEQEESLKEEPLSSHAQRSQALQGGEHLPTLRHRQSHTETSDQAAIISSDNEQKQQEEKDRAWLWLSDQGPLFSQMSEPVWVMEKLNQMLEKVVLMEEATLEDEERNVNQHGQAASDGEGQDTSNAPVKDEK